MRTTWILGGLLASSIVGCRGPEADLATLRNELFEAERAFARATAERGVDGWVAHFAPDGKIFQGGPVEGPDAIRATMAYLSDPDVSLEWEPQFAEVASSGDLGYTHGTYQSRSINADGNPVVGTGHYVTIWRRDQTGAWKVVLDIGNPDPPASE